MVTFKLISGDRSRFRPDEKGHQTIDVSKSFIFPTKWLIYQWRKKNIGVDDLDLFVREVSLSKMLVIDILSRPKEYEAYDFVMLSSEDDKDTVSGYNLKEDGAVHPFVNSTKLKLPIIVPLRLNVQGEQFSFGGPYSSVSSYNTAMISYFENYGVVLKSQDPSDSFYNNRKESNELCGVNKARNAWLEADNLRMIEKRQEKIRQRREEKLREQEERLSSNSSEGNDSASQPFWMIANSKPSDTFF